MDLYTKQWVSAWNQHSIHLLESRPQTSIGRVLEIVGYFFEMVWGSILSLLDWLLDPNLDLVERLLSLLWSILIVYVIVAILRFVITLIHEVYLLITRTLLTYQDDMARLEVVRMEFTPRERYYSVIAIPGGAIPTTNYYEEKHVVTLEDEKTGRVYTLDDKKFFEQIDEGDVVSAIVSSRRNKKGKIVDSYIKEFGSVVTS